MTIKNISIVKNEKGHIYKKYEVQYAGKSDIIHYSQDDWGMRFEPYYGNFSDRQLEDVRKELFDDAYYNLNFSKYN
jgi:hypothetical protein